MGETDAAPWRLISRRRINLGRKGIVPAGCPFEIVPERGALRLAAGLVMTAQARPADDLTRHAVELFLALRRL